MIHDAWCKDIIDSGLGVIIKVGISEVGLALGRAVWLCSPQVQLSTSPMASSIMTDWFQCWAWRVGAPSSNLQPSSSTSWNLRLRFTHSSSHSYGNQLSTETSVLHYVRWVDLGLGFETWNCRLKFKQAQITGLDRQNQWSAFSQIMSHIVHSVSIDKSFL
jgi:hypothetical protein